MPQAPLTRRQRQILDFYRDYSQQHGISPTLEEVAQNFGVNKVTIFGHVSELERKGVLSRAARGISRGLQLVDQEADREPAAEVQPSPTRVRILGRIAAGSPIETLEEPEVLDLGELLPKDRDVYALRVRGDSMIDDGVHDGDIVLVERRHHAADGDMVVAVLPDEQATLKRIYKEGARWRLQPSHPTLQPIYTPKVEVRGVVIGVVRRF